MRMFESFYLSRCGVFDLANQYALFQKRSTIQLIIYIENNSIECRK